MNKKNNQKQTICKDFYEKAAWNDNFLICGLDEAGRGCLAGPLVAAAVILPKKCSFRFLKDSKILTEQERNFAYAWITKNAFWSIAKINHRLIDSVNIYQATILAMKKALLQTMALHKQSANSLKLSTVVIDAVKINTWDIGLQDIPVHSFAYGESLSRSIAAASIIAKVSRDRIMNSFDATCSGYMFELHKGYGTKKHISALDELGESIIHRKTYLKNYYTSKNSRQNQQLQIF